MGLLVDALLSLVPRPSSVLASNVRPYVHGLAATQELELWNGLPDAGPDHGLEDGRGTRGRTRDDVLWTINVRIFARERQNADRKSTRLNSSHGYISYAVFC